MNSNLLLNSQNFPEFESNLRSGIKEFEDIQKAWRVLDAVFVDKSASEILPYLHTFFRLYSEFSWLLVDSMKQDFVKNVMAEQMIPMGIILGFPVWNNLLWYMRTRLITPEELESFYEMFQNNFLNSKLVVDMNGNIPVTLKEVIVQMRGTQDAAMMKKIVQHRFFSFPNGQPYNAVSIEEFTTTFQEFVKKIKTVSKNKIAGVIEEFVSGVAVAEKTSKNESIYGGMYGRLKNKNPQEILAELHRLSEKQNDPTIETLYYYDESDGQFHWNEELLSKR